MHVFETERTSFEASWVLLQVTFFTTIIQFSSVYNEESDFFQSTADSRDASVFPATFIDSNSSWVVEKRQVRHSLHSHSERGHRTMPSCRCHVMWCSWDVVFMECCVHGMLCYSQKWCRCSLLYIVVATPDKKATENCQRPRNLDRC